MRATEAMGGADVTLPLAIMTSGDTHARTEALLRENDYFGMAAAQARDHFLATLEGKQGSPL